MAERSAVLTIPELPMKLVHAYVILALTGTLVPWLFFGGFFAAHGLDIPRFVASLFANGAAGGFSADVLISIIVFWIWSFADSREHSVGRWWLVLPSACCVGLSLAFPFYLVLRAVAARRAVA